MNKELFVSSTPHETKVGLVEDDLLAEIYLERENEYTLAGSIYKGRVTRVLPGMQSAFVDIGLERDAFLYVSDFMELEEHDDDLTDVVPAESRSAGLASAAAAGEAQAASAGNGEQAGETEPGGSQPTKEPSRLKNWKRERAPLGRELRRSAMGTTPSQRDRGAGEDSGRRAEDGGTAAIAVSIDPTVDHERSATTGGTILPVRLEHFFTPDSGPPAGYQPIMLPGESISKYQRFQQPPAGAAAPHVAAEGAPRTWRAVRGAARCGRTFLRTSRFLLLRKRGSS